MNSFDLVRSRDNSRNLSSRFDTQGPDFKRETADFAGVLASWDLILAHKSTVFVVMLVCIAAAVGFTMLQTPIYRARTAIEVELRNESFLNLREIDPTLPGDTGERYLETQTRILQSEPVITKAIARLNRPVPTPSSPLQILVQRFRPEAEHPPKASEEIVPLIARDLSAQPLRQGDVIEVTFDYPDRRFAADFLNALTASFVEESAEIRDRSGRLTQARLNEQLRQVKAQLESSESALQDYARAAGLTFTSEKTTAAGDQLRVLEQELATARADRIQKESQRGMAASSSFASLPSVLDNPTLRDYQVKLMELRRQRAELLALFTPTHPDVKRLEAQIQEVESSLKTQRVDVIDRIGNEYEAARQREALLTAAVNDQTRRVTGDSVNSVRYNILQREVETNRALYDTMLQRARNADLASALETDNIRVIDPATVASRPIKPQVGVNAAIAGMGGIVLGIVVVLFAEGKDRRIRSPLDLRSNMNVQLLGVVPYIDFRQKPKQIASISPFVDLHRSHDLLADSFSPTLTSILSSNPSGTAPQTIVITSPTTGDGKSTVICNLGMALAEVKGRVLLIDADTRNPTLHRTFNIRNTVGLTDILKGEVEFSDALLNRVSPVTAEVSASENGSRANIGPAAASRARHGLYLLSRGAECENVTALLFSDRMRLLLQKLREEFDMVLIDTPPMLQLPHARVLGKLADGVALVLRSGQTSAILGREAVMQLEDDSILILGTVLNAFDSRRSPYKYYSRYPDSGRNQG